MSDLTIAQGVVALSDPHICSDFRDRRALLLAMFESLVRRDAAGDYAPGLARAWELAPDARSWRFALRGGVRFHNGDALRAADVVASLERVRDPALGGELGTQGVYASYLEGAELRARGDDTVEIVTREPFADLLDLLVDMPIAPARALGDLPARPVGSGRYMLAEAGAGQIVLRAFDGHHGGPPRHRELRWLAEPDAERRAELLLAGAADLAAGLSPQGARRVTDAGLAVERALSGLCVIVMLRCDRGPCADPRVRRALSHALDVPALIAAVKHGEAEQLSGPLTRLHLAYDPQTQPYPHDPALARRLLAEAGHPGGLELHLDIPTSYPDEAPELAALMAAQWAAAGITARVVAHEDRPGYADMVRAKQIGDACLFDSSPLSSARVLREKIDSRHEGPWWEGYRSPEVDALLDRAAATVDLAERRAIYRQAYRQIRDDAPWLFLYSPTLRFGVGPRAAGWRPGADGMLALG